MWACGLLLLRLFPFPFPFLVPLSACLVGAGLPCFPAFLPSFYPCGLPVLRVQHREHSGTIGRLWIIGSTPSTPTTPAPSGRLVLLCSSFCWVVLGFPASVLLGPAPIPSGASGPPATGAKGLPFLSPVPCLSGLSGALRTGQNSSKVAEKGQK